MIAMILTACSSATMGPHAPSQQDKANEQLALQNIMCEFEPHPQGKQSPCAHLIENRLLLGRFFTPKATGNLKDAEKNRGRRITTKFIVEAAASINNAVRCRWKILSM